jgi:nucleotide-binding universal stress UspA family protein
LKEVKRVLCAVDIDEADRELFVHALAIARRAGASLVILHTASPAKPFNEGATERVEFLRQLRADAEAAGIDVRVDVLRGDVPGIILLHAAVRHSDLIVIGAGQKGTRRLRSLTERVVREASCQTMVIPRGTLGAAGSFERILCAVDFSPASEAAVNAALRLARQTERQLVLFHVVDGPAPEDRSQYPWLATHEYYRNRAASALEQLQNQIPGRDRGMVLARVSVGNPASEIIRTAHRLRAQLLVIGARPRNRIARRLFGTTPVLLRQATCPLLAVPKHTSARAEEPEHVRRVAAVAKRGHREQVGPLVTAT